MHVIMMHLKVQFSGAVSGAVCLQIKAAMHAMAYAMLTSRKHAQSVDWLAHTAHEMPCVSRGH